MQMPSIRSRTLAWRLSALSALTLVLSGCISTPPHETEFWPEAQQASEPYLLQPGDKVQVLYAYWPDFDLQQPIAPDGTISLELIGNIPAANKSIPELEAELEQLYQPYLKDPEIAVAIEANVGSRQVFVGGEVNIPGVVLMPYQNLTLLEAVSMAGGFNKRSARLTDVVVVRVHEGRQYAKSVDMKAMLENPQSEPFYLMPYDVVYVPRTAIDQVNQWVDQYVNNIVPRNFYANYTWNRQVAQDLNTNNRNTTIQVPLPGL